MQISLDQLSPQQVYFLLTQTILPRPIAWVISDNGAVDGSAPSYNLAPFSFFNGVCSEPPLLMLSIGQKLDQQKKDTWRNIEERSDFVVHIPNAAQAELVNASAATLDFGVSEVEELKLDLVPLENSRLPRLRDCAVAFVCRKERIIEIGTHKQQGLILGQIDQIYLDDRVTTQNNGRLKVHASQVNPLSRLGADEFGTLGQILKHSRPK